MKEEVGEVPNTVYNQYPSTSAGSMRRLLTTGVTVPFPVSNIFNRSRHGSCARAAPIIVLSRTSIAGITFVDDQKICKGFMPSSAPVRLLTMLELLDSETTLAPRFVQMSDFSRRCCDGVMLEATASYLADLPILELPPRIRMVVPSFSVLMLGYHRAKNPL